MAETFESLFLPFSTADASAPVLTFDRGALLVRFRDWQEREAALAFADVAAFSWDDGDAAVAPEHRDDICYVVGGSAWIARLVMVGSIDADAGHRHYKLCFNAAGVLQVIATRLELAD